MSVTSDHTLLICATCKGVAPAREMEAVLACNLPVGFQIRMVDCMAGCARPTTVGFQASGKAQYLFGDIASAADLNALAEFAHQYASREDGWTNATKRPAALFDKTLSRMPRLGCGAPQ